MAERSSVVRLLANISDFKAQMEQARKSVKGVGDESETTSRQATTTLGRMAESAQKNRAAWNDAGTALTAFGAITVAGLGAAVKAAIDWESSWAGVTKTVSGTDQQLAGIEQGLRGLARTLPATHGEIAAVAEAAGQLGVQTKSIVSFTKTMVNLGETTNLSADQAATSLAQLMNVMGTAPDDVGRLGAALVALGNAGASTEADIVHMASYLTGSAKLIGASESDVLALANAMTSMGINAERGGGVMTRVMQDVYAAVQSGGAELEGFAKVAGMSADEFARAFEADPIRAIDAFVQGLNDVEASGGNVVAALNDLGFKGTQDTAVLLQMKGAGDLLTESLDLGSRAWEENNALVQEAAKRYDTTAAKLAITRNNITEAGIEIGQVFLPILAHLGEGVADVAGWFADLPEPVLGVVGGLAGVAGMAALAGGGFLLLFPRVIETYKAFQTLKEISPGVASGLGRLGTAARVAGGFMLLGAAVRAMDEAMAPTPATMEETTRALLDMDGNLASIDARFRAIGEGIPGGPLATEIDTFGDAVRRITDPTNTERLNDFGGALFDVVSLGMSGTGEGAASRRRSLEEIKGLDQALSFMVEAGNPELAAEQFDLLSEAAKEQGISLKDLRELFPEYQGALEGIENEQKLAAEAANLQAAATARLRDEAGAAYGSLETYAAALGLSEEATEKLIEDSNALGESLAAFIDPLGTYQGLLEAKAQAEADAANATAEQTGASTKSWQDFVGNVDVSLDEYMARLEEQLTAQQDWQLNMLLLAGQVSAGTLAELSRMGPEGAALVADLVNASDAELDRFDDITAARSKEATDAWGAQLTLAAPVLAEIGKTAGQGVVNELAAKLAAGTTTVAAIAAQYGIALADGVNPILTGLGKPRIDAYGILRQPDFVGPVKWNADGNLYEDHTAQIAQAGDWRVWAEPETGGEAYIPLSPAKRTRSVDIWRQVGDRLGVQFQEFAFGGITDVPKPSSTAPYQPPISTAGNAAMQKAYDEVTAWLRANTEAIQGGTAGSGAVGGAWGAIWQYVKARVPQARINSAYRPGDPGYHGRRKAVDLGFGSGPGGAGSAGLALINRVLHDGIGRNLAELIYDGIGDDRPDLKNGRAHTYNAATRAQHHNHVHAAVFGEGGILNPHVRDAGGPLLPGFTFNGTGRPETVLPNHVVDAGTSAAPSIDYGRLAAALRQAAPRQVTVHTADNPRAIVRAIRADEQQQAALAPVW